MRQLPQLPHGEANVEKFRLNAQYPFFRLLELLFGQGA